MVKRSLVIVLVGLVCMALGVTASLAQPEERTFHLKADGLVSVENSAGNITIHAWDQEEVRMVTTRKGRESDKIEIIIDASEDHSRSRQSTHGSAGSGELECTTSSGFLKVQP